MREQLLFFSRNFELFKNLNLTNLFFSLIYRFSSPKFDQVSNSINNDFAIMVPAFYMKYAIFGFKMSSQVKSDPAILTGLKKHSWSQNLRSLSQKMKKWCNYMFSRRFGRYSFQPSMFLSTNVNTSLSFQLVCCRFIG